MVVRKAIHHLRGRPADERRAVAAALASAVAAVLFIAWLIIFFRNMRVEAPVQTAVLGAAQDMPAEQP